MADVLTEKQRSFCMSRIRSKNTAPEMLLRKSISSSGLKGYRIHYRLIGKPDVVFPRRKIAIFLDGCFWHRCPKCFVEPVTRKAFWLNKISSNVERDKVVDKQLKDLGWKILRIWEHDAKNPKKIEKKVIAKIQTCV